MTNENYYDFGPILSYNAGFNFIVGGRGIGKTFGAEELSIKDALYNGWQFAYVRRYSDDIKVAKATFFDAIVEEGLFPEYEFTVDGSEGRMAKRLPENFDTLPKKTQADIMRKREWVTIVHFFALSMAAKYKSTPFPKIRTIIYDEFIIEKGFVRYLPNETEAFLGLYSTIARNRKNVRAIFLANSVSLDNPFFISFNIDPDIANQKGIIKLARNAKTGRHWIVVHFPDSAVFDTPEFDTPFRQFITDTMPEYADYAVSNQFQDNHKLLIEGKDYKADYLYSIETEKGTFSVWNKFLTQTVYVQSRLPKKQNMFTTIPSRMSEDKIYLEPNNRVLQQLRSAWRTGNMRFDSAQTRNGMLFIFKK